MPLDREAILSTSIDSDPWSYDERATMLYALGVGFADDDVTREIRFVSNEGPLYTVPTLANGLLDNAFFGTCVPDARQFLQVGERLDLYRPLPPSARMLANRRVASVADLGPEHGLEIEVETELRFARDDTVVATCWRSYLTESEGGGDTELPHRLQVLPQRDPDLVCTFKTPKNQALLSRLLDSMSTEPGTDDGRRESGPDPRQLQPLCVYGIACRAILHTICNYDFTLIDGFEARFTAPAFAGESISTEMWQDGNVVSFRCRVPERDSIIIDHGRCALSA